MQDFRKLEVWARSHQLVLAIYRVTESFPKSEQYGLVSQMRRAAVSVPANIAEGCTRQSQSELARFLHISLGSASELEYYLVLCHDLKHIPPRDYELLNGEVTGVKRMLTGLMGRVRPSRPPITDNR